MDFKNFVHLVGYLGNEPTIKQTVAGKVARLSIAINSYIMEDGKRKSKVEWHTLVAWNALAEKIVAKCKKGNLIAINGHLNSYSYENNEKGKQYVTNIVIDDFICNPCDNSERGLELVCENK